MMKAKLGLILLAVCLSLVVTVLPVYADVFKLVAPAQTSSLRHLDTQFQDETIKITFVFMKESREYRQIGFILDNMSDKAIAIDWDRCSFTSPTGEADNIMHAGEKFIDANRSTPPTTIPPGSKIIDAAIPSNSVSYSSYLGWTVSSMHLYEGAEFGFYLFLTVEGESRDYNFRFKVKELTEPQRAIFRTEHLEAVPTKAVPTKATPTNSVVESLQESARYLVVLGVLLGVVLYLLDGL